jgi:hypothetical protein
VNDANSHTGDLHDELHRQLRQAIACRGAALRYGFQCRKNLIGTLHGEIVHRRRVCAAAPGTDIFHSGNLGFHVAPERAVPR